MPWNREQVTARPSPRRQPVESPEPSSAGALLSWQRRAGNKAVVAALSPGEGTVELWPSAGNVHPVAATLGRSDVQARLPNFADLKAAYTDKKLRIPQAVVKDRVAQLLGRMQFEKRLKSKDPVPSIVAKIFPGPGVISQKEFEKALDPADRSLVYQTVFDADTAVKKADRAKLKALMKDAGALMATVEGDAAGLTAVFGGQDAVAKSRYAAARSALATVASDLEKHVTTDYNLDDPEISLGGWASHSAQVMHLLVDVVKGTNPAESKATLIHESAHLGSGSVVDLGYYATPGFEAMSELDKVNNAAHFEELPRRAMGVSSFVGHTFKPNIVKGGGVITRTDVVRKIAGDHLQHAWDAAADAHMWLRGVRKAKLRGDGKPFTDDRALIMELSQVADLTIHTQSVAHAKVTTLDVTIIESIARAMGLLGELVTGLALPPGPFSDKGAAEAMVAEAAKQYGHLLGDAGRDKTLIDWLAARFHNLPSPP
ncbi:hypothetical protein [Amycolatopsis sp. NPDC051716]|uniref:hypothetical protein n=1 Tax=Amycolatopsis sp. NPDC051716 TaxID=3155804 RepID=UPI00342EC281